MKTMTVTMHVHVEDMSDDELTVHIARLFELIRDARREQQNRHDLSEAIHEDTTPDNEADAQTLAMAGWGTDEDYGYFGDNL